MGPAPVQRLPRSATVLVRLLRAAAYAFRDVPTVALATAITASVALACNAIARSQVLAPTDIFWLSCLVGCTSVVAAAFRRMRHNVQDSLQQRIDDLRADFGGSRGPRDCATMWSHAEFAFSWDRERSRVVCEYTKTVVFRASGPGIDHLWEEIHGTVEPPKIELDWADERINGDDVIAGRVAWTPFANSALMDRLPAATGSPSAFFVELNTSLATNRYYRKVVRADVSESFKSPREWITHSIIDGQYAAMTVQFDFDPECTAILEKCWRNPDSRLVARMRTPWSGERPVDTRRTAPSGDVIQFDVKVERPTPGAVLRMTWQWPLADWRRAHANGGAHQ